MIDLRTIDELARRLRDTVPEDVRAVGEDLETNFRAVLSSAFDRMELVTREEFEAQKQVLERSREKLEALERRLAAYEQDGDA
mgnify:CR=1 FL=1